MITPKLFRFFRELRKHNDREWFTANKARYEEDVRAPLLQLITDFSPRLKRISRSFVADPRPVGGSLLRIHRDTRFSPDKTPYKTHAGIQFRHIAGKDIHAPGFYLHLAPGEVFLGCGVWHPDGATLHKVREAIATDGLAWKRAIGAKGPKAIAALSGESLKRAPAGYDPAHPLIDDLRRKDYITISELDEEAACADDFVERIAAACKATAPFMQFLTRAIELPW
jgi:uncharacterized protein (TIGR02453 family)